MDYFFEIAIVLILIVLNGIFSMSEFALVSSRKTRLRKRAEDGDQGAATALRLTDDLTPFLSTIQIGMTLVGIFTGAFGEATIARGLEVYFREIPSLARYSNALSIILVVLLITYLTLIFGELVPKRLALNKAESIATRVAKPMYFLSILGKPLIFVLSYSTDAVLQLMRVKKTREPPVTEEEIKIMLEEGTKAGVFEKAELNMIEGVFDIGDLRVDSIMTHRNDIVALDLSDPVNKNMVKIVESGRSSFPVYERDLDRIIGIISVKDILAKMLESHNVDLRALTGKPLFVPEALPVLKLLELFKETRVHIALITDEYGIIQGVITLHDILEEIIGDVRSLGKPEEIEIVAREDGSWLVDGDIPIGKLKDVFSVDSFPGEKLGYYRTVAGLIMFILQRIPKTGDNIEVGGLYCEVVDIDGNRIDKVLIKRVREDDSKSEVKEEGREKKFE